MFAIMFEKFFDMLLSLNNTFIVNIIKYLSDISLLIKTNLITNWLIMSYLYDVFNEYKLKNTIRSKYISSILDKLDF